MMRRPRRERLPAEEPQHDHHLVTWGIWATKRVCQVSMERVDRQVPLVRWLANYLHGGYVEDLLNGRYNNFGISFVRDVATRNWNVILFQGQMPVGMLTADSNAPDPPFPQPPAGNVG
jgi:hypothetical protein